MENTDQAQTQAVEKKKKADEFSLEWHIRTLAIIYVLLGIFYIVLKVTLK